MPNDVTTISPGQIVEAHQRIAPHIRETYLQHSPYYSQRTGANVYFKCENLQFTGSFKLRGAMNKILSLTDEQKQQGVVAASTGNHGKAVAHSASQLGGHVDVFAPSNADRTKLNAIESLGATIHLAGSDCIEAESAARVFSVESNAVYISPYNDPHVIAGQGTIAVDLCQQLDQIDAIFASVGGGGLISGIATYARSQFPNVAIVGCSPENSKVMLDSLEADELLDLPSTETLSDGTAGGVESGSITFELCQQLVKQRMTVTESEIANCLIEFVQQHSMLIEGAAAVPIAGLMKSVDQFQGKNVVIVLCGANISPRRLQDVFSASLSNE